MEGTCSGRYGFIIAVTDIEHMGSGKVQEGTGAVLFPIKFKAIVFRPFKGEIVDALVSQVNKVWMLWILLVITTHRWASLLL